MEEHSSQESVTISEDTYIYSVGDIIIIGNCSDNQATLAEKYHKLQTECGIFIVTKPCRPYIVKEPEMTISIAVGTLTDYKCFGWGDIMWMVDKRIWDWSLIGILVHYFDDIMLQLWYLIPKYKEYEQCRPWIVLWHQIYHRMDIVYHIMDASLSSRTKEVEIAKLLPKSLLETTFINYDMIGGIINADQKLKQCLELGIDIRL